MVLILILVATVFDHLINNVEAKPGNLFDDQMTFMVWSLELVWVVLFGIQAIITLQPHTPILSEGLSVQPETIETRKEYTQLIKRLEGTDFALISPNQLNTKGLKDTYQGIISIQVLVIGIAVLVDVILWRIVGSFGGGINILEEYFISGMSLILYVLLLIFSAWIFPEHKQTTDA